MHALIGVHAHGTGGIGEPESTARLHPITNQIACQALAQAELEGFGEPALPHVENQEGAGYEAKYAQLAKELCQVPVRQRIIEGLVPGIEAYLAKGGHRDDQEQRTGQ